VTAMEPGQYNPVFPPARTQRLLSANNSAKCRRRGSFNLKLSSRTLRFLGVFLRQGLLTAEHA